MFLDIGWTEMLVIAVVLIVVVGPKDLPGMLRTFGRTASQLRSMAGDFRKQFDEALKEAELDDVKKAVDDVRSLDPRRQVRDAMKPMREIGEEIRSSMRSASEMPANRVEVRDREAEPRSTPPMSGPQMEPLEQNPARADSPAGGGGSMSAPSSSSAGAEADGKPLERHS